MRSEAKILQIGNYPPPMCGWAIQTKLVTEELRRRGHICDVLKINENREVKTLRTSMCRAVGITSLKY